MKPSTIGDLLNWIELDAIQQIHTGERGKGSSFPFIWFDEAIAEPSWEQWEPIHINPINKNIKPWVAPVPSHTDHNSGGVSLMSQKKREQLRLKRKKRK